jgi:TATA-binding protein-associated factor
MSPTLIPYHQKFYLEYRVAVGYAKQDPGDAWPSFKTLEEWEPLKSTKMDTCARVVAHYLSDDNIQDVTFVAGCPVFPELVKTHKDQLRQTRRIIIYAEFSSMAPLLQNVCIHRLCPFFRN